MQKRNTDTDKIFNFIWVGKSFLHYPDEKTRERLKSNMQKWENVISSIPGAKMVFWSDMNFAHYTEEERQELREFFKNNEESNAVEIRDVRELLARGDKEISQYALYQLYRERYGSFSDIARSLVSGFYTDTDDEFHSWNKIFSRDNDYNISPDEQIAIINRDVKNGFCSHMSDQEIEAWIDIHKNHKKGIGLRAQPKAELFLKGPISSRGFHFLGMEGGNSAFWLAPGEKGDQVRALYQKALLECYKNEIDLPRKSPQGYQKDYIDDVTPVDPFSAINVLETTGPTAFMQFQNSLKKDHPSLVSLIDERDNFPIVETNSTQTWVDSKFLGLRPTNQAEGKKIAIYSGGKTLQSYTKEEVCARMQTVLEDNLKRNPSILNLKKFSNFLNAEKNGIDLGDCVLVFLQKSSNHVLIKEITSFSYHSFLTEDYSKLASILELVQLHSPLNNKNEDAVKQIEEETRRKILLDRYFFGKNIDIAPLEKFLNKDDYLALTNPNEDLSKFKGLDVALFWPHGSKALKLAMETIDKNKINQFLQDLNSHLDFLDLKPFQLARASKFILASPWSEEILASNKFRLFYYIPRLIEAAQCRPNLTLEVINQLKEDCKKHYEAQFTKNCDYSGDAISGKNSVGNEGKIFPLCDDLFNFIH